MRARKVHSAVFREHARILAEAPEKQLRIVALQIQGYIPHLRARQKEQLLDYLAQAGHFLQLNVDRFFIRGVKLAVDQKLFSLQPFLFVLGIAVVSVSIRLAHHFVH